MANVTVVMSGDEARLFKSLSKVVAKEQEMAARFRDVGKAAKDAGKLADQSFSGQAMAGLKNYATGLASIATAAAVAREALQRMHQESVTAGRDLNKLAASNQVFNQIATSAQDLQNLQTMRDKLAMQFGEKPEVVADLISDARQLGFSELVDEILAARQIVSPSSAAAAVGQVPQIFKGQISGLESLNAILKGSETSSLKFEDVAEAIPKAGEGAVPAGASPAEVIALASTFSAFFARSDTMSDRLKAFGSRLSIDPELKGKGIVGGFQALQAMPEQERRDWLGMNQELNAVYNLLTDNIQKVIETQKQVEQAIRDTPTQQSMLNQGIARSQVNPEQAAQMQIDRATVAAEIARRQALGVEAAGAEAAIQNVTAEGYGADRSQLSITGSQMAGEAVGLVTRDPGAIAGASEFLGSLFERQFSSPLRALTSAMPPVVAGRAIMAARDAFAKVEQVQPPPPKPPAITPDIRQTMRETAETKTPPTPVRDQGGAMNVRDEIERVLPTIQVQGSGRERQPDSEQQLAVAKRQEEAASKMADAATRMANAAVTIANTSRAPSVRTPARPTSRPNQMGERNAHRE